MITLNRPFTSSSGKYVSQLELVWDNFSVLDIKNAMSIGQLVFGSSATLDASVATRGGKLDPCIQVGLAWVSAIKSNPTLELTTKDVMLLEPLDMYALMEECQTGYLFR